MSAIPLRAVPGLWIGRRQVLQSRARAAHEQGPSFQCGSCEEVIQPERIPADLRDVVVKCGCGAYNQA